MRSVFAAAIAVLLLVSSEARSSSGPEIPGNAIRIIVPFSAGGSDRRACARGRENPWRQAWCDELISKTNLVHPASLARNR